MEIPDTRYARSGDVSVAYQVFGGGRLDLVLIRGSLSELSSGWEQPRLHGFLEELGAMARVVAFDKRGTGLSDRQREVPTLEARMDDVRAVMDAAGVDCAVLWSAHEGTRIAALFAATYPERVLGLVMFDPQAKGRRTADYPWARDREQWRAWLREVAEGWGSTAFFERYLCDYSPTLCRDPDARRWFVHHMRQSASPGAAVAFQRMAMEGDVSHVLGAIRVPTLLLHRATSAGPAIYVASRIPHAVRHEIPNLVDSYSWADPAANELILDETRRFLNGLERPTEAERVLATVLFTDIVGSSEHAAEVGDEEWRRLLERHNSVIRQELARYRGTELKTLGDGFLASFDGPARAVRCACAVRDAMPELGLELRAGLHTGEIEQLGGDIGGIAVHIAARIAARAGPGEVVVSSTVKDLVAGSGLRFADRGEHSLKGIPDRWRLFLAAG